MHAIRQRARIARAVAWVGLVGLAGCLSAFAPAVRVKGPHAGARADDLPADCLACHELESEALARMQTDPAAYHAASHNGESVPLVADWMVTEELRCTDCHTLREPGR